jgi:ATP-dependent DNA ligase
VVFQLKWDGFRAIVSTEDGLAVRSRRGWNMTAPVPELQQLPYGLVLDGELAAGKGNEPTGKSPVSLTSRREACSRRHLPSGPSCWP